MKLILSNTSGVPIYEQLRNQIRDGILSGQLREGEALPSLRQLAKDLRISVLTVTRAYTQLEQEGFVANVQGKGCYVLSRDNEMIREQLLRTVEEHLEKTVRAAQNAGLSLEELGTMAKALWEETKDE